MLDDLFPLEIPFEGNLTLFSELLVAPYPSPPEEPMQDDDVHLRNFDPRRPVVSTWQSTAAPFLPGLSQQPNTNLELIRTMLAAQRSSADESPQFGVGTFGVHRTTPGQGQLDYFSMGSSNSRVPTASILNARQEQHLSGAGNRTAQMSPVILAPAARPSAVLQQYQPQPRQQLVQPMMSSPRLPYPPPAISPTILSRTTTPIPDPPTRRVQTAGIHPIALTHSHLLPDFTYEPSTEVLLEAQMPDIAENEEGSDSGDSNQRGGGGPMRQPKKRDKKANEKARRIGFNNQLKALVQQIPGMADYKDTRKSVLMCTRDYIQQLQLQEKRHRAELMKAVMRQKVLERMLAESGGSLEEVEGLFESR